MLNRINQLFQDSPKNLLSIYFCAAVPPSTVQPTLSVPSKETESA